jgi:MauM/NapG family ferredoxin protein
MKRVRVVSQIVFFALFVLSFSALNRQPQAYTFPSEWFLWVNPLVGLIVSVASRHVVLPAVGIGLVVLVASVLFGRFFCGMVCPLGAVVDFSDRYALRKMYSAKRRPPSYMRRAKYMLLAALLVLSLFGVVVPLFMDPISVLTRIMTIVIHPLAVLLGQQSLGILRPGLRMLGFYDLAYKVLPLRLFYGIGGTLLLLAVIVGGGFWDRRFWCQYLCPSGAFFGLVSRFTLFRRVVKKEACTNCKRCIRVCPTRAIDENDITLTSTAECILCGDCTAVREGCSRFAFGARAGEEVGTAGADIRRRTVVAGVAAGVLAMPLLRANALGKRDDKGRLIRPPGAVEETEFLARCIGCGECMKACPTNAIQPCTLDDGVQRLCTPKIVPRIAGCEEKCYLCGHVCPTGALRKLPHEEKSFAKIGTAVIDRHRCLAWSQNKECVVCDEVCPYNAIDVRVVETTKGLFKAPIVSEDMCLGCGMCEQHCPIGDQAAIVVYKFGENRRSHGPYATQAQKEKMLRDRRKSDAHLSVQASSRAGAADVYEATPEPEAPPEGFTVTPDSAAGSEGDGLPPGFVF